MEQKKSERFFSDQKSRGFLTCSQCGICCKLFLINLNKGEYLSGKYQTVFDEFGLINFEEAELTGANILKQKEDDSCIYLERGKCSIHKKRPEVCRNFFCDSKEDKFKGMIKKIKCAKSRACQKP